MGKSILLRAVAGLDQVTRPAAAATAAAAAAVLLSCCVALLLCCDPAILALAKRLLCSTDLRQAFYYLLPAGV